MNNYIMIYEDYTNEELENIFKKEIDESRVSLVEKMNIQKRKWFSIYGKKQKSIDYFVMDMDIMLGSIGKKLFRISNGLKYKVNNGDDYISMISMFPVWKGDYFTDMDIKIIEKPFYIGRMNVND